MRLLRGRAAARPSRRAVVTVGVFDGVHLAHQQLVRRTVALARRLKGMSVVVTFDPDPHTVLHPSTAPPALMPLGMRCYWLQRLGAGRVWVIPFTRRFARTSAAQFVQRVLIGRLQAVALVVGEDFAFGRGRAGTLQTLRRLGAARGMRIEALAPVRRPSRPGRGGGRPISSSRIRALIARGRLDGAARLLGRPAALYGTVVRGAGRGRALGFPTANVRLCPQVTPPRGVYAVRVQALRGLSHRVQRPAGRAWPGVMNLGVRPTFGGGPVVCEVYLFGFSGALLHRPVCISLLARLRAERRFATPSALSRQIARDARRARTLLARLP
ncbi:MAG: riboflavin biosynthesis protein RibF [Candidatus Omnitrophica bacterium]|nr:riboflavin biosynthesis protein RibF [Candidatus Omnitrophota bacterium]